MAILAFDGGGTKTRCLLATKDGDILADTLGGTSNHQICGAAATRQVLESLAQEALQTAGLKEDDLEYVYLGLAGADLPQDFAMLDSLLAPCFGNAPRLIVNDAWIIMRSGLKQAWGAVCICGTGANAGAVSPDGQRFILRSLSYELGNYGGGGDIVREALHHAFRADEKSGPATALQKALPLLYETADLAGIVSFYYPEPIEAAAAIEKKIPPLVFELARTGDAICQNILTHMGDVLGQMTAGRIEAAGLATETIPVVLGGSVFSGNHPLFIDALQQSLHRKVPAAYLVRPELPPVAGAFLGALDELGIPEPSGLYTKLQERFQTKA